MRPPGTTDRLQAGNLVAISIHACTGSRTRQRQAARQPPAEARLARQGRPVAQAHGSADVCSWRRRAGRWYDQDARFSSEEAEVIHQQRLGLSELRCRDLARHLKQPEGAEVADTVVDGWCLSLTVKPIANVLAVRVERDAENARPRQMVWRSASGTVIKTITRP